MRFDARNGDRGEVYDANGRLIPYALQGDTDTGLVESLAGTGGGTRIERHPAPLYIKPLSRWVSDTPTVLQAKEER